MTLQDLLPRLRHMLNRFPPDDAMRDIRRLAAAALEIAPDRVTLRMHDTMTQEQVDRLIIAVEARMLHMPVAKILQKKMFWSHDFYVDSDVLDPRPETECLIEAALALGPQTRVLDLGTGSGVIAVTLALDWARADITACDLSPAALVAAEMNVYLHGVADGVTLVHSDWYDQVRGRFDLIVSNPPYIAADEMDGLSFDVRTWEPRMALTDEGDGLSCYRIITAEAGAYLNAGGWLMVEIGLTQGRAVRDMFTAAGFNQIEIRHDLDGRDRVVVGQKPL